MLHLFKKKEIQIYSPVKGRFKNKEDINDPVFSKGLMGETFAIIPEENQIYAPFDGEVISVFPTKHALGLISNGLEIIIHVGIDTVNLKGEGFEVFIKDKDKIKKGDLLLKADFDLIKEKGYMSDVVVAITKSKKVILNSVNQVDNLTVIAHGE